MFKAKLQGGALLACNKETFCGQTAADKADLALFSAVLNNTTHVLHQLLPPTNTHSVTDHTIDVCLFVTESFHVKSSRVPNITDSDLLEI